MSPKNSARTALHFLVWRKLGSCAPKGDPLEIAAGSRASGSASVSLGSRTPYPQYLPPPGGMAAGLENPELQSELLRPFVAFDSEMDNFPFGEARQYWNEKALSAKDARLREIMEAARPEMHRGSRHGTSHRSACRVAVVGYHARRVLRRIGTVATGSSCWSGRQSRSAACLTLDRPFRTMWPLWSALTRVSPCRRRLSIEAPSCALVALRTFRAPASRHRRRLPCY